MRNPVSVRLVQAPVLFLALFSLSCAWPFSSELVSSAAVVAADGISGGTVTLTRGLCAPEDHLVLPEENGVIEIIAKEKKLRSEVWFFKSTLRAGSVVIRSAGGLTLNLSFYKTTGGGAKLFSPEMRLLSDDDRRAFIEWFVRIADSAFLKPSSAWDPRERDCAGLVRFAYREALKKHDTVWSRRTGIMLDKNIPDVIKFNYPDVPVCGKNIFCASADASGHKTFSAFADAKTLCRYNTFFVSRDMRDAGKGDILFFFNEGEQASPYHSMIVVQNTAAGCIVLYHTGSADGVIKRVPVSYLKSDQRFYPAEWNKNFLGVYRFCILE